MEPRFIVLAAYIVVALFRQGLRFLNLDYLKKHGGAVPPEFEGHIDAGILEKTRDYTIEKSRFGFVESVFDSIVLLVFIYGGLLDRYNDWVLSLDLPFVAAGLVFFLLLSAASTILSIPFSLYATFGIENRYGFNTTTPGIWIGDFFKSLGVSVILTALIGSASLALVQASPDLWWLWVWLFMLAFGIFFMYVSPYVIEPLFNKYVPVKEEALESRIRSLMDRVGIRVSRIQVVDASKRSRHSNAYFTGIGRVKRIVLFDTLLETMSLGEVIAVLAHEAGHWKRKHVLKRIAAVEALSLAGLLLAWKILDGPFLTSLFHIDGDGFFAGLVLLAFAGGIALFPLTPLMSYLSRRHEREADAFACDMIENPEDLAGALIKLSKDNLANLHPHPFYAAFYYSHPPILERIQSLRAADAAPIGKGALRARAS
jgi:STE24 endopeptidase